MTTAISAQAPPLGPLSTMPAECGPLKQFKILLLVTSINSFTQRVISYLQYLEFEQVSVQLATSDEEMLSAAEGWDADLVLCPFLTKKLPEAIYSRWITLVVHPGPPGDAGPSSLDWALMGDDGTIPNSSEALDTLINKSTSERESTQRSHWGTICFQANEELDGGAVWAWEQYPLPRVGSITKAQLYQGQHSIGAMSAVIHALCRVYSSTAGANIPKEDWLKVTPKEEWSTRCVTLQQEFMGGKTLDRPLLQSTKRRPNFDVHTAEDILRILNASDSQPGAMLNPLTSNSKSSLFAYGAHLHRDLSTIPASLYVSLGYESFSEVPNGRIIATRQGAIFIKTRQVSGSSAGLWITHGRVPRGKDRPIDPKIPMVDAIHAAGHGSVLEGVREWEQSTWSERTGEWQEVFVKSVEEGDGVAQLVYWNFYNGAFTTSNCQYLLKALQWATSPERGNVKILALMGGNYFSNGIALNTIEHAQSPGAETWANINAIDDIVSFLVGDTASEVPDFLQGVEPLCKRGIVTVACVRGNAAAGGVALAAACDVVMASRGVVLNPSYRGMGLHGSELHSYSYLKRCGPVHAATLLRAMKPLNTSLAHEWGLIDIEIGSSTQTLSESEPLFVDSVRSMLSGKAEDMSSPSSKFRCAPWCRPTSNSQDQQSLVSELCENKLNTYENRDFPPLLHYRNEELSQMLLDSFHPIRSNRYHSRRYRFIRKVKADSTPSRYILHHPGREIKVDEEDTKEFDDAPNWTRGEEWGYVGLVAPKSLESSEKTRIDIFHQPKLHTQENQPPQDPTSSAEMSSQPIQRKPSEAPTLLTMPSLSAHPISPTMSTSSSAEGPLPTTPMLVESPPRRVTTSATSSSGKMEMSTSTSTHSKRLSLFRSHSSSAPGIGAKQNHVVDSQEMMGQFGSITTEEPRQEKDKKKGTLKSLKKKFRSVLKGLNGESSSSKPKSPSAMGSSRSISSNSVQTTTTPIRSVSTSTSTRQTQGGSAVPVPSPDTAQQQGTCEWPCLTTGGEGEEHVIEGQGQRPKVEQVAQ